MITNDTLLVRLNRAEQDPPEDNYHRYLRFRGTAPTETVVFEALVTPTRFSRSTVILALTDSPFKRFSSLEGAEDNFKPIGVYLHQNELQPHVAARYQVDKWLPLRSGDGITAADIAARRAFYVDIDPVRPRGVSATEDERSHAVVAASTLLTVFEQHLDGSASLGVGSSGNGVQIHVALDALSPDETEPLIRDILSACGRIADSKVVKVDESVSDARRTCPVFGTTKRKGENHQGPDIPFEQARPHRRTAFVCDDNIHRLSMRALVELRDRIAAAVPTPPSSPAQAPGAESQMVRHKRVTPWELAKQLDIELVSEWLGLGVGSEMRCPGCGSIDGYGRIPESNITKCHHDRCASKGVPGKSGTRTTIDLVVEAKTLKPADALKALAIQFELKLPGSRRVAVAAPNASGASWEQELLYDERGNLRNQSHNVTAILQYDPAWLNLLGFDELRDEIVFLAAPPTGFLPRKISDAWRDDDDVAAINWLQRQWGLSLGVQGVRGVVSLVAHQHSFHPVRDDLNALHWDGIPRVNQWLRTYFGARPPEILDDNAAAGAAPTTSTVEGAPDSFDGRQAYTSLVGRWWLISAVARAFIPGCKVDTLLILEGRQGLQKSLALRTLAGKDQYFLDDLRDVGGSEAAKQLRGKWIIELSELDAFRGRENTQVKRFMSQQSDNYRPSYGRTSIDFPRQCVFAGTTNRDDYLNDETGGRRFWPVRCTKIDIDALRRDRDQIWAEAVHLFHAGEVWWPRTEEEMRLCAGEQDGRQNHDDWMATIVEHVEGMERVTTEDVLRNALRIEVARISDRDTKRVAAVLYRLGWRRTKTREGAPKGKAQIRVFERPPRAVPVQGEAHKSDIATSETKGSLSEPPATQQVDLSDIFQ